MGDAGADEDPLGGDGEGSAAQFGEEDRLPGIIEAGLPGRALDHDREEVGRERRSDRGQLVAAPGVELRRALDEVVMVEDHPGGLAVGHLRPGVGVGRLAQRPFVEFLGEAQEAVLEVPLAAACGAIASGSGRGDCRRCISRARGMRGRRRARGAAADSGSHGPDRLGAGSGAAAVGPSWADAAGAPSRRRASARRRAAGSVGVDEAFAYPP